MLETLVVSGVLTNIGDLAGYAILAGPDDGQRRHAQQSVCSSYPQ
jgi:hypothetical protein